MQRLVDETARKASALERDLDESRRETLTLSNEIKRIPANAKEAAKTEAAVYALMCAEAEDLRLALEDEEHEFEELRKRWRKRADRLMARRQEILKRIGSDAEDMKNRALRMLPPDPRAAQLRQELDAMKIIQERTALETGDRIRDLTRQLAEKSGEADRLAAQVADAQSLRSQIQQLREKLQLRERQMLEQQREVDEMRERNDAAQQALLARISALEGGAASSRHAAVSAEPGPRFPPWMGLKK